eukprot:2938961-Alexandrium_andersonii.AAC.1
MAPQVGLALPLRSGPVVLRCFGHEEAIREARGAAELVAGWARRKPVSYTHLTLPTICSV